MLKNIVTLCIFVVTGISCGSPALNPIATEEGELISDITPAVGKGSPPAGSSGLGPWATRIMLATSTDGLTFTRTNEILADQTGVPNILIDHDGRARIYYNDFGNGNIMAVAIRNDNDEWAYRRVTINKTGREGTQFFIHYRP